MSWGTLDKGILTKRVTRERRFDESDCRSWAPWWKALDHEARYKKLEVIQSWCEEQGLSLLELAIGFNLATEGCEMVLVGARNQSQLEGVLGALKPLAPTQYQSLLELLRAD